jgi:hypothetical protein
VRRIGHQGIQNRRQAGYNGIDNGIDNDSDNGIGYSLDHSAQCVGVCQQG